MANYGCVALKHVGLRHESAEFITAAFPKRLDFPR